MVIDDGAAGTFNAVLDSLAPLVSEFPQIDVYLHFILSAKDATAFEVYVTVSTLEFNDPESIVMLEFNGPRNDHR